MTSNSALELTIDKILKNAEQEILSGIKSALDSSHQALDDYAARLEGEYDKILSDGRKEADKIEKQIVGSSDLEARNRQLVAVEEAVDRVFEKALEQIAGTDRGGDYADLIRAMMDEATRILGTSDVTVLASKKDADVVKSSLSKISGAELSSETIDCLGGVIVKSKDGTMTFDNTIDARIERMKPLIRKQIATKFGIGN